MKTLRTLACSWAVILLLLGSVSALRAQDDAASSNDVKAHAAFEAGLDAYDRGRFSEAVALYDYAYALTHRPEMLFNIGRAAEADDQDRRAIDAYDKYLVDNPTADNREFVTARLRVLRARSAQQPPAPAAATAAPVAQAPLPVQTQAPAPVAPQAAANPNSAPPLPLLVQPNGQRAYWPQAEPPPPPPRQRHTFRLYGGMRIGARGTGYGASGPDLNLKPSFGLTLGLGWVWRVFGLGFELRERFFGGSKSEGSPHHVTDVLFKPRLGYKFDRIPFDFYFALPLGISATTNYGNYIAIGGIFGASYFFSDQLGASVEVGYEDGARAGNRAVIGEWAAPSLHFIWSP